MMNSGCNVMTVIHCEVHCMRSSKALYEMHSLKSMKFFGSGCDAITLIHSTLCVICIH